MGRQRSVRQGCTHTTIQRYAARLAFLGECTAAKARRVRSVGSSLARMVELIRDTALVIVCRHGWANTRTIYIIRKSQQPLSQALETAIEYLASSGE